jgi:hypothetical protein
VTTPVLFGGHIKLEYYRIDNMVADISTKALAREKLRKL